MSIPKEIEGGDWPYVFAYAGESASEWSGAQGVPYPAVPPGHPDKDRPQPTFSREDVVRVIALVEGENDGPDWICVGKLRDGRFFSINAGCDYTGWG